MRWTANNDRIRTGLKPLFGGQHPDYMGHLISVPAQSHTHIASCFGFKEYSLEIRAELPQTKVADSQPSPRAGRPEGLV